MPAKHRQPSLRSGHQLPSSHARRTSESYEQPFIDDYDADEDQVEQGTYRQHRVATQRQYKRLLRQPSFALAFTPFGIKHTCWYRITLRRLLCCLVLTPFVLALSVLISGVPPSYEDIRAYERLLPQHNLTRAKAEGHKYLKFRGHLWGHGLNNILQETILMSYLSHLTNRSFVYQDYIWSQLPFPYTVYDFALRPSRIPFNAFISGPTAGGPISFSDPDVHRIAVSDEFYNVVCPPSQVHLLPSRGAPHDTDGASYIQWWVDRLSTVPEITCLEIDADKDQVFDLWLFGEKRILTLWDDLSRSSILQNFSWSHLVLSAVLRNLVVLRPPSKRALYDSLFRPSVHLPISSSTEPLSHENVTYSQPGLPDLVAVHIRRGDFSRACYRHAKYKSTYMGLNQFQSFVDVFDPEPYITRTPDANDDASKKSDHQGKDRGNDSPGVTDLESYYMAHCFPSITQVVTRLHKIRRDNPGLKSVYILSNAWGSWLRQLKKELMKRPSQSSAETLEGTDDIGGWEHVITSYDLVLDPQQRYIDMAVDMAIAEQARVFVGNGFSSASSNVVMLRMAKGMDPRTNRFL